MGISVIMPSYLGNYAGSRENSDLKFIRAVDSFKNQTLKDKELIIVSDGCEITNNLYEENYKNESNIRLVKCEKSEAVWPGTLREVGRSIAKYEWIHYLDTDDFDFSQHLELIHRTINSMEPGITVLFNEEFILPIPENPNEYMLKYVNMDTKQYTEFYNQLKWNDKLNCKLCTVEYKGHNGTWQIVHHKDVPHRWRNSETMGEDTDFIQRLKTTEKYTTFAGQHVHCHATYKRHTLWEI